MSMPENNIVTNLIHKLIPTLPNQYIFPKTFSHFKIICYSIFALSCLLNMTGANDKTAHTTTIMIDLKDITSPVVVKTYNSTPALMKPNDGGATPKETKEKLKM